MRRRGVPEGAPPRLEGEARGGRAELVSVAVSPWTWGSRKPEKRGLPERSAGGGFGGLSPLSLPEQRVKPSPPELLERLSAVTEAGASWADPALSAQLGRWRAVGFPGSWVRGLGQGDAALPTPLGPSWFPPLWVVHPGRGGSWGSSAVSPESLGCLGAGATRALVDFGSRSSFRVRLDFEGSCSPCGFSSVTADRGPAPGQSLARLPCAGPPGCSRARSCSGARARGDPQPASAVHFEDLPGQARPVGRAARGPHPRKDAETSG